MQVTQVRRELFFAKTHFNFPVSYAAMPLRLIHCSSRERESSSSTTISALTVVYLLYNIMQLHYEDGSRHVNSKHY